MPTYELVCRSCDSAFEVFRMRTLRDDEKVCPECGSTDVKQKVSGGFFSVAGGSKSAATPCGAPTCSAPAGGGFG